MALEKQFDEEFHFMRGIKMVERKEKIKSGLTIAGGYVAATILAVVASEVMIKGFEYFADFCAYLNNRP
ncbi:MAG: hypothetical protein PHH54_03620 [Candidatus Nanoarchaeia archaeon]|nr:hypothetical protein [Candidatus Nanoarchaeia archaeon]MDD5741047.1 hypothetical protein [Candidatus Nanoarchaeia archaeon]